MRWYHKERGENIFKDNFNKVERERKSYIKAKGMYKEETARINERDKKS